MTVLMLKIDDYLEEYHPKLLVKPWISKPTSIFLRYLLKEKEINLFIKEYPHLHGLDFIEQILEHFHFSYSVRNNEKENIPPQGRLIIAANHPIGSLDGLALIKLISETRRDIKVITNEKLMAIEALNPILLPADRKAPSTATDCLESTQKHLQQEGAVIIFPAGEVSRLRPQGVRDARWKTDFLSIAKTTKAPILPVFIDGKNSPLFYTISMLYKPLATLLIAREMFKQRTKHLPIRISELVAFESYNKDSIPLQQTAKLFQKHVYRLGQNKKGIFKTQKPIAPAEDRQELTQAIRQHKTLGETADGKEIILYRHSGSSPILREIGRLREITFRAVGEGTNKRRDIDTYDSDYFHLVLWDKNDLEIVGAYRFGDAAQLTKNKLYSASLFHYSDEMQPYFKQGLELGRSFVQPKYWGKRSLDYLWYGIGAFLQHNPQYRYLFGPVSISNSLPDSAKQLIVCFYQLYFGSNAKLASSDTPYHPPVSAKDFFTGNNYKEDFTKLKSLLSNMGSTVPTLYKQYTETYENGGVHFLAFSVDPLFNYCIDGLVLADLSLLKEKKRQRYMPNKGLSVN